MINLEDRHGGKYSELMKVIDAARANRKIGSASPAATLLKIFQS